MMNGLALVRNRKKMIIRCFPWGLEGDNVSDEIEKGDH